jgi:hypothetical protein
MNAFNTGMSMPKIILIKNEIPKRIKKVPKKSSEKINFIKKLTDSFCADYADYGEITMIT